MIRRDARRIIRNFTLAVLLLSAAVVAGYRIKPLSPKAAAEFAAHQESQGLIVGAMAALQVEQVLELFDSKKIHERGVLPVLVVIENRSDSPIRLREQSIYLVLADGTNIPSLPFGKAFLMSVEKKSSSILKGTSAGTVIGPFRNKNKEMYDDFEHKQFGEKLIPPQGTDYGVLFYPRPTEDEMERLYLYLPEIENVATGQDLIFFELDLRSDR